MTLTDFTTTLLGGSLLIVLLVCPVATIMYALDDDFDGKAFGFFGHCFVKLLRRIFG